MNGVERQIEVSFRNVTFGTDKEFNQLIKSIIKNNHKELFPNAKLKGHGYGRFYKIIANSKIYNN
jgi:hypothetical protein